MVNSFVRPFGDLSSARHAVRFDLVGKGCSTKVNDLSFALKTIRQFDASKSTTAKGVVKAAKLMASTIHQGLITGKSRRRAGSWSTQSNESALLGSSECKTYCRRIIGLNRRRSKRSRLSKPVVAALEDARRTIASRNWKQSPVGLSAFTSSTRMLLKEYCRLQAGFYLPSRLQGAVTTRYLSPSNPLVRFSPHYVLSDGISLLDIGAGVGVASALAARTPSVRITAIEPDALSRGVLRTNLALLLPHASYVPTPPPLW